MSTSKEKLNGLKQEYDSLTSKLSELSEDELKEVTGGCPWGFQVGIVNIIMEQIKSKNIPLVNIISDKTDLTGSVATVQSEDLNKQNETNPIKALQGKVAGMNISIDD